jgi:hypothetical protein
MSNRFCSTANCKEPAGENLARPECDSELPADFNRLPGNEIERLIALCEAPGVLWRPEPAPARAPEPFGMIV